MFHELIYTRCRQGMDILKRGQSISTDGYKVYACTPALMDDGVVDLPFFANAVQVKQSYNAPNFMDDAYLYYVPDNGASFLVNFHPVVFDLNTEGDYSHRPGNFVNHAFVGNFLELYPFEMFKDANIWDAKARTEAYYYENAPIPLPLRNNISDVPGQYTYEEIGDFIANGRQQALATAISFLITQYELAPEKRKFLVIRDASSREIELWIAAIEYAFSPKMASAISFATRMDKFVNANRYTVNQLGVYQPQINFQDPNQRQRFRAMIVGVDERDTSNAHVACPLANSLFVLLDGKEKHAMFEADISDAYYQCIIKFDEEHQQFCREFLQTFNIMIPSSTILLLYSLFKPFNDLFLPDAHALAKVLKELSPYEASNTPIFIALYKNVRNSVSRFLQEDVASALSIIHWLQINSKIVGDDGLREYVTRIVSTVFLDCTFYTSGANGTQKFWEHIKKSEFSRDVACALTDIETIQTKIENIRDRMPVIITFVTIYLECAILTGIFEQQNVKETIIFCLKICYNNKDITSVTKIATAVAKNKTVDIQEFLFSIIKDCSDDGFAKFLIEYIVASDNSVITSDSAMLSLYKRLYNEKLEHSMIIAVQRRLNTLRTPSEFEQFIKTMRKMNSLESRELIYVFESIDKNINICSNNMYALAELVQLDKPLAAFCKNSAHVYALKILSDQHKYQSLTDIFNVLTKQGFPSIQNQGYIASLTDILVNRQRKQEEQLHIIKMLAKAPESYFYSYALCVMMMKQKLIWNNLIRYASENDNEKIEGMLIQILVDSKQSKKSLGKLEELLNETMSQEYFNRLAEKAWERIGTQKLPFGLSTLVGLFKRKNDKGISNNKE